MDTRLADARDNRSVGRPAERALVFYRESILPESGKIRRELPHNR